MFSSITVLKQFSDSVKFFAWLFLLIL